MIRLAAVIESFQTQFLEKYRDRLRSEHLHALAAIKHCRSKVSPAFELHCTACDQRTLIPHSCGHRHCPHCQHHDSQQWIEREQRKLLPVRYFLVTFTLPAAFRPLAAAHPRTLFDLMLRCAWDTLDTFSRNDRQLQGTPGATAVLHTHSRALDFHPHVHAIIPAAAIDQAKRRWRQKRPRSTKRPYLFNEKALAKVLRAKILDAITAAELTLPERHPESWVVHCTCVGSGEKALVYLGRYLYRGVIREADILECSSTHVRFRFRNSKTNRFDERQLPGADFLWLVLQHVLPKGFRRTRCFGFLHPNCKRLIAVIHLVLKVALYPASACVHQRPAFPCPCCGSPMRIVRTRLPDAVPRAGPGTVELTAAAAM
jgi:hypothetical protein